MEDMMDAAESNVTQLPVPSAPKPPIHAGVAPRAIVPSDFDQVWRLAIAIEASGLAPKDMNRAEQITVAIMHGLEIGLPPMQSVQRICVINGRPTLWGDGVMAVVRASGKLETIREWMEGEGDSRVAICEAKRRDDPTPIRRTFSIADAKAADLLGKKGPWQQYRERMMQMRARAFCLRDGFADVMGGFYVREEVEDEIADNARDVTPRESAPVNTNPEKVTRATQRPGPPPTAAIEHKPAATAEIIEPEKAPDPVEAKAAQAPVQQEKRRPGPPPGVAPRPAPAPQPTSVQQAVADVQKVFPGAQHVETRAARAEPTAAEIASRFSAAADKARAVDELNERWTNIVEPHIERFTADERSQLSDIHGSRFNELDEG